MKEFSLEILQLVSQYLTVRDLKQLQLVNKSCYKASIESLYSTITLKNERQVVSFIRTVSKSQSAGRYVKKIAVSRYFYETEEPNIWEEENILDTIIEYCSNLREIIFIASVSIIWARLMLAANRGKLLNLQRLPLKYSKHIESYICTALCFKKSLTFLNLWDCGSIIRKNDRIDTKAFQYLRNHITEFSNIRHLSIRHHTNQPFNHLDAIIDDCPNLRELEVELYPPYNLDEPKANKNILASPRPDIYKLTCCWINIYEEDQLKYIPRKFTNLRYLIIRRYLSRIEKPKGPTSDDTMMEFIVYLSTIPTIELFLDTTRKEFAIFWNKFIQLKKEMLKVCIVYTPYFPTIEINLQYNKKSLNMSYVVTSMDTMMPHDEFLRVNGSMIKSLTIASTFATHEVLDEASIMKNDILCNENWIYQTLQSCPSLQELTLANLVELKQTSNNEYQHIELKKLNISDTDESKSLKFLRNFSIRAPNLKHLHLHKRYEIEEINCYFIEIDMPYTTFVSITIEFKGVKEVLEVYYIKLNTIFQERYFVVDEDGTHELSCTIYHQTEKSCLFEITCLGLKQFKLKRPHRFSRRGDLIGISEFD